VPHAFWPRAARLAVTVSIQVEAASPPGLRDERGGYAEYGIREGVPRLLNLFDKYDVPVTAFLVGDVAERHPDLVAEIVERGHEVSLLGWRWADPALADTTAERDQLAAITAGVQRATGIPPAGYNRYWSAATPTRLQTLRDLGFRYHVDDVCADEPLLYPLGEASFATVPYATPPVDFGAFPLAPFSPGDYEQQLSDEFDQLHEEGGTRRRMMSIPLHDPLAGHAGRVRVLDRFLRYATDQPRTWFARREDIADWARKTPFLTPTVGRETEPAPV
jgi:peptidoglycan/xylan/chitin deacetylase (PgdA/CDA1 family)